MDLRLSRAVVSGTDRWETLTPFQATYWKELPTGFRVRAEHRSTHDDGIWKGWEWVPHRLMALQEWYNWR